MSVSEIGDPQGLTVEFPRCGDRFASVLKLRGEPLAESREGDADEDWPSSPPLQQLSIEDLGNGPVGLLVGMAGHSHWSLAVEARSVETENGGDAGLLVFDAACRVRGAGGSLGSAYRLAENITVEIQAASLLTKCNDTVLEWSAESGKDFARCELEWNASNRILAVRVAAPLATDGTVRWKYRVRVR